MHREAIVQAAAVPAVPTVPAAVHPMTAMVICIPKTVWDLSKDVSLTMIPSMNLAEDFTINKRTEAGKKIAYDDLKAAR